MTNDRAAHSYRVEAVRSGDWWSITVPELSGVFSQAKRLDQVERSAREAIAMMLDIDEAKVGSLEVDVTPPATVVELLKHLEDFVATANEATDAAAATLAAKTNRLAHVVKWMKRYGDAPPYGAESGGESGGESGKPSRGESGGESGGEKRKALVSEGESQGKVTEKEKLGKGNIYTPPKGGISPPEIPKRKTSSRSHGEAWVNAPAAPATAKNATSPRSFLVRVKSLATATPDPTSNGAAATSKPNTAKTDSPLSTASHAWKRRLSTPDVV